ncbi:MAG: MFS transporter [Candidatus Peregrinibacteria bacterium]|nr:MFS transporter [Candidatus Peregrinibacteria bacterium]
METKKFVSKLFGTSAKMYWFFGSLYFVEGLLSSFLGSVFLWRLSQAGIAGADEIGNTKAFAMVPWLIKPVFAILVDRTASKLKWVVGGSLLMIALILAMPLIDGKIFALVSATFLLINLSISMIDVPADGLAVQIVPEKMLGFVNGVEKAALYFGVLVGGAGALTLVALKVDWVDICVLLAVIVLIFAMVLPWMLGTRLGIQDNNTNREKGGKSFQWKEFLGFLKSSQIVWAMVLGLLANFAAGFTSTIPYPILIKLGYTNADFATMNYGDPIAMIAGVVAGGVVARYASKALSMGIGMIMVGLSYSALGVFFSSLGNHMFFFVLSWTCSFVVAFADITMMKLFMGLSDKRFPALSFALLVTMSNLCNFASPLASRLAVDAGNPLNNAHVFVIGGGVQFLTLVPLAFIWRWQRKEKEAS